MPAFQPLSPNITLMLGTLDMYKHRPHCRPSNDIEKGYNSWNYFCRPCGAHVQPPHLYTIFLASFQKAVLFTCGIPISLVKLTNKSIQDWWILCFQYPFSTSLFSPKIFPSNQPLFYYRHPRVTLTKGSLLFSPLQYGASPSVNKIFSVL